MTLYAVSFIGSILGGAFAAVFPAIKEGRHVSVSWLLLAGLVTGLICHFGIWRLAALVEAKAKLNPLKEYTRKQSLIALFCVLGEASPPFLAMFLARLLAGALP